MKLGSRAEIRLEAYPDVTFPGEVIRVGDLARPSDRVQPSRGTSAMDEDLEALVEPVVQTLLRGTA